MNLNDLLAKEVIDPTQVIVLRHRPTEPQLNKVLPWLAAEKPDVFNLYQQVQTEKLERAMLGASHVATFIGREPGKALFVGLYEIKGSKSINEKQFWQMPGNIEMRKYGMRGFVANQGRPKVLWFNLVLLDFYSEWKGRLVVNWPPPERSWWRRAHKNNFLISCIHDENQLVAGMAEWDMLNLAWAELGTMPTVWKAAIRQWRGVYYIFDTVLRKGYVGSASGSENILGRWLGYAASGHGGNKLLKPCDPNNFRFSILQRVSPDMSAAEVVQLENTWKERLHTRAPLGLNEN